MRILVAILLAAGLLPLASTQKLLGQQTEISLTVYNAANFEFIKDAEVSYFDRSGRKIPSGSTNSEGFALFDVPFAPGEEVIIQVNKFGSFKTEQFKHRIKVNTLGPNEVRCYLRVFEGIKVRGRVYHGKMRKRLPIKGASIIVPDPTGGKETHKTNSRGYFEFNTLFSPGESLPIKIEAEGFEMLSPTITVELEGPRNNDFEFFLSTPPKVDWCDCLLYGSLGTGVISGATYWAAGTAYNNYQDFSKDDRQQKYDKANSLNRVSLIAAGFTILLGSSAWICKEKEKKILAQRTKGKRSSFFSLNNRNGTLGFTYHF